MKEQLQNQKKIGVFKEEVRFRVCFDKILVAAFKE